MSLPPLLAGRLALPVVASPMFIVSGVELVVAQCRAGIVGSFPALNARAPDTLDGWLTRIREALAAHDAAHPERPAAPFAVNQIVHKTNARLEEDVETCVRHRVPIVITSLSPPTWLVERVHAYGGLVIHDVVNLRHARKAIDAGVDGLVLVSAGAGGHAGAINPFALVAEVRRHWDGLLVLGGSITNGRGVVAAQALGCDLAYVGTRFIATQEANASEAYRAMLVESQSSDILYTPYFSGVPANYLRPSIAATGLDPDALPSDEALRMDYQNRHGKPKAWSEVWSAGHGVGDIVDVPTVEALVARMRDEARAAREAVAG